MLRINLLIMKSWCNLCAFLVDRKGASGIEYAIIATIAAVAIALFATGDDNIADRVTGVLSDVKDALPQASTSTTTP